MTAPDPSRVWQRVEGWMRHAAEDARMARGLLHMEPPARGGAAYHCQQAAEKLLKGFLVRENIDFARTHDLDRLGHAVADRIPAALQLVASMRAWTTWGVAYRYPGEAEPEPEPSVEELIEALDLISRLAEVLRLLAPPAAGPSIDGEGTG